MALFRTFSAALHGIDAHVEGDSTPFSLWVTGVGLTPAPESVAVRPEGSPSGTRPPLGP